MQHSLCSKYKIFAAWLNMVATISRIKKGQNIAQENNDAMEAMGKN